MKTVLEAFTPPNKSFEMKSSEKSPTSRLSAKRNHSSYRKNTINRFRKGGSIFPSGKKQRTIGDFFSGRIDRRQQAVKSPSQPTKSARKCLFERSHKNTAGLDETSSSSFTYSSNSQRFIDVDIAGHCSRLDIDGRLEVVELTDNQPFNRSENEESEKENSPRLKRTQSGSRPSTASTNQDPSDGKAAVKLNQAVVKELEFCEESSRDDFCRPEGYYRYLEGDCDERQEKVEYDLDDEDMSWLNIVNTSKCSLAGKLTQDSLEMAIDRMEKMSAHLQLNSIKDGSAGLKGKKEDICDDDIFCSICLDDECQNSNVILLCDSCNLAVHQDCYGIPYVPEGQWLCSWCLHKKESTEEDCITIKKGVSTVDKVASAKKSTKSDSALTGEGQCCLCPVKGGALKKTSDGRWAHVLCALWIPEVGFESIEYLEPITKLDEIPPARHKLTCSVCKRKDAGACIQCMKRNCYVAFHIMCAQKVGTYMKIEQGSGELGDSPSNIKKSFYCDQHKPEGAKPFTPMYDDDSSDDNELDGEENGEGTPQKQKGKSKKNAKSKGKMSAKKGKKGNDTLTRSKSSKSLTAKSSGSSLRPAKVLSDLPKIPSESLMSIESECFDSSQDGVLIDPIYNYWILKRKSRNNMPLLKAFYTTLMSNNITEKLGGADDAKAALQGLKDAKKLRNEMEKVRLLLELVRKREKVKLLTIKAHEQEVLMRLHPWNSHLMKLLNNLQMLDKCDIFAQPVSLEQVPGYNKKIDEPMDFSTMRQKVADFVYNDLDDFEKDFNLMIDNCLRFNSKHTMYYKAAAKLRKQAEPILKEAHDKMIDMSCEPMIEMHEADLDETEMITNDNQNDVKDLKEIDENNESKIKKIDDDDDDDDQCRPDETICYDTGKADIVKKHDDEIQDDVKMNAENERQAAEQQESGAIVNDDIGGEDHHDNANSSEDVKEVNSQDVNDENNYIEEGDETHELSTIEATKLYCYEEVNMSSVENENFNNTNYNNADEDEEEDDSNDLIIETISINDEEDGTKGTSLAPNSVDVSLPSEETNLIECSQEMGQALLDQGTQKATNKEDILRFLSALTRLIQTSSEALVSNSVTMNAVSNSGNESGIGVVPQPTETGVVINVSKEMVAMMASNSRPKSTRKSSSIYRRQSSALNFSLAVSPSKRLSKSKTPLRLNFDPKNNSTPFNDIKQTFKSLGRSKSSSRCRTKSKKPTAKKSSTRLESEVINSSTNEMPDVTNKISPKKILPETMHLSHPLSTDASAATENRRTSERTKTATHRYLIDDDNILAALMTPSKNRKRKNSCQDNSADEPLKSRVEDEPPVLSRCPSPIEEEEVSCTMQSTFSFKPAHKGLMTLSSSSVSGYDGDEDFAEPSFSSNKQRQSSSRKCQSLKNSEHCNLEPAKKRLKLEPEMAPPLLIKSSLGPLTQKSSKVVTKKTSRPSKCRKVFPLNGGQKNKANLKSILSKKLSPSPENNVVDVTQGIMPELEKNLSGDQPDCTSESQLVEELPRLNENISYQNLSLTGSEVISFTTTHDEDVLVAEECYADMDDPGVVLDKSVNSQLPNKDSNQRVFFGIFKAYPIPSPVTPSKKRFKDAEDVRHIDEGMLHVSKKTKTEEFKVQSGKEVPEASRSQRLSIEEDVNISSTVIKETSAEELTAANALLDFKMSFCHGDGSLLTSTTCSKKKNIFDEFKKLSTMPSTSKSTNTNQGSRKNFTPVVSKPSNLLEVEASSINSSNAPHNSVLAQPLFPSATPLPQTQVPATSCTSQVQFFPWSEKSLPGGEEPACQFSGNPEVDSAYSTSSSSSSLLISSPPSEERCNNVL